MPIYAVKTTARQEKNVAEALHDRMEGLKAVLVPSDGTAYILAEANGRDELEATVDEMRHARSVTKGEMKGEEEIKREINPLLTPEPSVSGVNEGDMVEVISGPFKGEKAWVKRVDDASEEVTVELHESTVPIPVTVRGDHVRVLESEES